MRKTLNVVAAMSLLWFCSACQEPSVQAEAMADTTNIAYADPLTPGLPQTPMTITRADTALVIVNPQIDFLSPDGAAWGAVGKSVTEHDVVDHLEELFAAAQDAEMRTFVSPRYYYPSDKEWRSRGRMEELMHDLAMFHRSGLLDLEGFEGSGADWMPQFKSYINAPNTIVASPHKIYGPENTDLVLQMRKRGIDKVILAGMSANLSVQAHMHELIEQGFEVMVVRDATAGAMIPEGDGYLAALINFRFMASETVFTHQAVERIKKAQ